MNNKAILTPNPALPNQVITINPELCVSCYQCADICRCNVILPNPKKDEPPVIVYHDECWHCAVCTENCPTGAIKFEHPLAQKITFKDKKTGELYRIGMENPPEPYTRRAYGDYGVRLPERKTVELETGSVEKLTRFFTKATFKKIDEDIPDYKPGHFINLKIDDESYRGYSIGNAPGDDFIELYIDMFPNGKGGKFFEALKKGQKVQVTMPLGRFYYVPNTTPVFMVGSGTGVSSIKGMIDQELFQIKSGRKIKLLFLTWDEADILLKDYFDKLLKDFDNFTYDIILSNPDTKAVKTGKICEECLEEYIANSDFINKDIDAYICGSKLLVKSCETYLFRRAVFWKNIRYESFL